MSSDISDGLTSLNRGSLLCCGERLTRAACSGGGGGERYAMRASRATGRREVTAGGACAGCSVLWLRGQSGTPPLIMKTRNGSCSSSANARFRGVFNGGRYRSPELSMVVSSRPLLRCRPRCDWVARSPAIHFYTFPLLIGYRNIFLFCQRPMGPGYRWPVTTTASAACLSLLKHHCLEIHRSSALAVLLVWTAIQHNDEYSTSWNI